MTAVRLTLIPAALIFGVLGAVFMAPGLFWLSVIAMMAWLVGEFTDALLGAGNDELDRAVDEALNPREDED